MENRKFLTKKRVVIAIVLAYLLLPFWISYLTVLGNDVQWVYFKGREIKGRVIDAETSQPVEDAIIVASWRIFGIFDTGAVHIHILLALNLTNWLDIALDLPRKLGGGKEIVAATDKNGEFVIPEWSAFQPWTYKHMTFLNPQITIYKPGYKVLYPDILTWERNCNNELYCPLSGDSKLTKSLTAKEIEEDFEVFQHQGLYGIPAEKDWLKAADLVEKGLLNLPPQIKNDAQAYFQKHLRGSRVIGGNK